jgi:hypothetical protein
MYWYGTNIVVKLFIVDTYDLIICALVSVELVFGPLKRSAGIVGGLVWASVGELSFLEQPGIKSVRVRRDATKNVDR